MSEMGFSLPSPTSPHARAKSLAEKKEEIEQEIQSHLEILRTNNVTMQTPLVDPEGFPRTDVDIFAVRRARVRIIELRNDLKGVVDDLAVALEEVYRRPEPSGGAGDAGERNGQEKQEEEALEPFARVDAVAPQSPASEAGMQKEDLIIKFGSLVKSSFSSPSSLAPLATLVAQHENKHVIIQVIRSGERKHLTLTPRKGWGGRGLLGCHIVPHTL